MKYFLPGDSYLPSVGTLTHPLKCLLCTVDRDNNFSQINSLILSVII